MSAVLFFDATCQKPYARRMLEESALGGTEASVIRIAEALDARVMQHNRTEADGRYQPIGPAGGITHLIVLRDPRPLESIIARYPGARCYLWMHDLMRPGSKRGRRLAAALGVLSRHEVTLICVSDFQRAQVESIVRTGGAQARVRAVTLYNPVDDRLAPDGTAVDPAKLVFFSSPNKGLAYTLDAFRHLRRQMPELRLCVGSPGYKSLRRANIARVDGGVDGVHWLGSLPQQRILAEVRSALCVFYPNFVLPETFGLVLAEAKAVGTPVLTHDCGAAAEVLGNAGETLPVRTAQRLYEYVGRVMPHALRPALAAAGGALGLFDSYAACVRAWREGARPVTGPDPRFLASAVAQRWRALFGMPTGAESSRDR